MRRAPQTLSTTFPGPGPPPYGGRGSSDKASDKANSNNGQSAPRTPDGRPSGQAPPASARSPAPGHDHVRPTIAFPKTTPPRPTTGAQDLGQPRFVDPL